MEGYLSMNAESHIIEARLICNMGERHSPNENLGLTGMEAIDLQ